MPLHTRKKEGRRLTPTTLKANHNLANPCRERRFPWKRISLRKDSSGTQWPLSFVPHSLGPLEHKGELAPLLPHCSAEISEQPSGRLFPLQVLCFQTFSVSAMLKPLTYLYWPRKNVKAIFLLQFQLEKCRNRGWEMKWLQEEAQTEGVLWVSLSWELNIWTPWVSTWHPHTGLRILTIMIVVFGSDLAVLMAYFWLCAQGLLLTLLRNHSGSTKGTICSAKIEPGSACKVSVLLAVLSL